MAVFQEIAERTGGAVLYFRAGELGLMAEVLNAVAILAIGDRRLLASTKTAGSRLLLEHIKD